MKHKILVSGCLGGARIRYNATGVEVHDAIWQRWTEEGRLVHFCPEVAAGMSIPRPPAEIIGGRAADVLDGRAAVHENTGADVTKPFLRGAHLALDMAQREGVALAVLTDGSPSCGTTFTYDGTFSDTTVPGRGVMAELLVREGIRVFAHTQLREADTYLARIEKV